MEEKKTIHFPNLDVVRFLCAFMIIAMHTYGGWKCWRGIHPILTGADKQFTPLGKFIDTLIGNLGYGVDIFFLISGFLITYLLFVEKETNSKVDVKKFLIRRVLRIWPLYFFIVIMGPVFLELAKVMGPTWLKQPPTPDYLPYYFFLGNFQIIKEGVFNFPLSHLWSICVEEHFYVVWPFIIAFVPNKHLTKVFLLLALTSMLFRVYYYHFDYPNSWKYICLHTVALMDTLVMGSYCAYLYHKKPVTLKTPAWLPITALLALIVLLGWDGLPDNLFVVAIFRKYLYNGLTIFIIANFMFNQKAFFKRRTPFHYLGKISYGIYMYQSVVISLLTEYLLLKIGIKSSVLFYGVIVAATIIVPVISWELFEKHILKIKKRFEIIRTAR